MKKITFRNKALVSAKAKALDGKAVDFQAKAKSKKFGLKVRARTKA